MRRYFNLLRNLSNWWLYLAVKFGLSDVEPILFRTRKQVLIEVPRRLLQTFKEIFMDECYMVGLGLGVPDSPVVIDIGANAGFFTLFAASRFSDARILSFEPVPSNFRQLERNRSLNMNCRITCFEKAVAGHSGKVSLGLNTNDSFSTYATIFERQDKQDEIIEVPCVTLPEIFDEFGLERCDMLKMDCEGAEYEILYNCPSAYMFRISQIAMEVHGGPEPEHNIDSLEKYLNSRGFTTRRRPVGMLLAWRR